MSASGPFLPYGRQAVDDDDIAAVVASLKSDWLTTGPAVGKFENAFAEKTGARHAVACANGTAGLHLALLALGIGHGDRVIAPTLTFLATANAARYVGADVVFADVDPDNGLLTPQTLEDAFARAGGVVKAVLAVHLAGQPADMAALSAVAAGHGAVLVEDACHAIGGSYLVNDDPKGAEGRWTNVGACAHGAMAVFSLHPVKTITMGEGGVVTTNDDALAARLRRARSHGMTRDADAFVNRGLAFGVDGAANPWYYEMADIGYNYRATDMQCALGASQLAKLDRFVARRGELVALYDRAIGDLGHPALDFLKRRPDCRAAWHLYVVLVDFSVLDGDRAALMNALSEKGVGTQVHYLPVHMQPYYKKLYGDLALPGAWRYYSRCLSLPLFPAMDDDDVLRVVAALGDGLDTVERV
ncbi:UDP-4-amino-4,6-dideoxy-N-acetyl-beta-L-altrosamine transaminase [Varunaivibrio sulfuroxidans]|uniref:UDP-4-amino-4, 6-dideoxy-N-acetyl-beta-L-altrosamine transaminase n=1 Tax=Varunaivibrio sulfuroxidans TaxID=1773489 RepID=A0A4R3JBB6_9PROT|nr:UDP-4-amino-4,6-dideoxy-N-acetyl-beta-L-altrosamine transaminase [Varunaivibrio sulfuroxidans]TCS62992.1 UDP-4-amino-4,6-dideoxy-N-acetyl-beta-L-altrosamine transaminase [Varunaivibrio sulfuroxidans]WES31930.1 UDP-4-amino-4,6-dideoxy-N-acetyl-beta-L-altrosamine transaminase [Varunaivibrio sulfuroxidans]